MKIIELSYNDFRELISNEYVKIIGFFKDQPSKYAYDSYGFNKRNGMFEIACERFEDELPINWIECVMPMFDFDEIVEVRYPNKQTRDIVMAKIDDILATPYDDENWGWIIQLKLI